MSLQQRRIALLERRYRRLRQQVIATLALGVLVLPSALREWGVSTDPWRTLQLGMLAALVCFVVANGFWDWRDARTDARELQPDLQHSLKETSKP